MPENISALNDTWGLRMGNEIVRTPYKNYEKHSLGYPVNII